jgi:Dolichyl-phosphate-mannose-protein mannosyltransferase
VLRRKNCLHSLCNARLPECAANQWLPRFTTKSPAYSSSIGRGTIWRGRVPIITRRRFRGRIKKDTAWAHLHFSEQQHLLQLEALYQPSLLAQERGRRSSTRRPDNRRNPMIPHLESLENTEQPSTGITRRKARGVLWYLAIFAALFACVVWLQWHQGAYSAEFSGYPDEPAHYMSGLLFHDYVKAGLPTSPIRFAENFYLHYPYLAIGHWPPGFYALEGLWMLGFSTSRVSIMFLMAFITAGLAFSTFLVTSRVWTAASAAITAVLLISMPVVQSYAGMVMADTLLALLSFWAVHVFGEYVRSERPRYAVWFAILSTAAILTKANGFLLAAVPIFTILLTRRFGILKRLTLWLSAAFVAAMCLPWHVATMHMMIPTFGATASLKFITLSSAFYIRMLVESLGPVGIVLSLIGLIAIFLRPRFMRVADPRWAAQAALGLSYFVFYCGLPAGIETRYLIVLLPTALLFANVGAETISRMLRHFGKARPAQTGVLAIAAIFFFLFSFTFPSKASYGFQHAADAIAAANPARKAVALVSTETHFGEGIFTSEMAMRKGSTGEETVLRASKVLADDNWNGTAYIPRYKNAEQLDRCIEEAGVGYLVLDSSKGSRIYPHHRQLLQIVQDYPEQWRLVERYADVSLFQETHIRDQRSSGARVTSNMNGKFGTWPVIVRLDCSADTLATSLTRVH